MKQYVRKPGDKIFRPIKVRPWHILLNPVIPNTRTPISSSLTVIWGFAGMIIIGALLLMLPIASRTGQFTSPINAFFTATSATCVTGLVVLDTADYWSLFGHIVIITLIQLGGFGFMTSATFFLLAFGRRIGLREKVLIGESIGITRLGGIVKLIWLMAGFTFITEAAGAVCFYIQYSNGNPTDISIWLSVFQSISSFNNAGFDLSGNFQSLSAYQTNPLMLLVTAGLIIIGGIGFLVIVDLFRTKWKLSRLSLDTKLVLSTTGILLLLGTAVILLTEFRNTDTLGNLTLPYQILNAFFQSVTARTAGFNTVNIGSLATYTIFFLVILMFIGGSSGSTAGGVKVNTFGMLSATVLSTIRGKEHAGIFGREFSEQQINRALTVVLLSIGFICVMLLLLTLTEGFKFIDLLFETVSAFGTVGLSRGITPDLSIAGRLIIAITMFVGRLGPFTVALALVQRQQIAKFRYKQENVRIG
jgi:trk system potassium uptake protein TrkH